MYPVPSTDSCLLAPWTVDTVVTECSSLCETVEIPISKNRGTFDYHHRGDGGKQSHCISAKDDNVRVPHSSICIYECLRYGITFGLCLYIESDLKYGNTLWLWMMMKYMMPWIGWLDVVTLEVHLNDRNSSEVSVIATAGSTGVLPLVIPLSPIWNCVLCWIPFWDKGLNHKYLNNIWRAIKRQI